MKIRKFKLSDIIKLLKLQRKSFGISANVLSVLMAMLLTDDIYIIEDNQKLIGALFNHTIFGLTYLFNACIDPKLQNTGIGSKFGPEILDDVKGKVLFALVEHKNKASLRLTEKIGFKRLLTIPTLFGPAFLIYRL